jgi:hypothetical protein
MTTLVTSPQYYNCTEMARIHRVSVKNFRNAVRRHEYPIEPLKLGKRWFFPRAAVDRLVAGDIAVVGGTGHSEGEKSVAAGGN